MMHALEFAAFSAPLQRKESRILHVYYTSALAYSYKQMIHLIISRSMY